MTNIETVFFDLDGTLTDPKAGITKSIQYALEQMGFPSPPLDELTQLIGPPLHLYFSDVLGVDKAQVAIGHYRQRYIDQGMCLTENILYPGIEPVLRALRQNGKRLFVVTAKPEVVAETIVQHFGLSQFFQRVYGAELDETRSHKDELIAYILEHEKLSPNSIVMVGDRKHDIQGATANSMRSIGVLWGYGTTEELEAAGATYIAQRPDDLLDILLSPEARPAMPSRRSSDFAVKS